jgi:YHS domain-containing protein
MFRTLFFILALALGLSLLMRLVISIARSVQALLGLTNPSGGGGRTAAGRAAEAAPSGHFVRDPESGTYIDQNLAIKTVIEGETYFFESEQTRDAFLRKAQARG